MSRLLSRDLSELPISRLHLLEQPHVLDRGHGLVCEGRDELDLLLAVRQRLRALQREDAYRDSSRIIGTPSIARIVTKVCS